MLSKHVDPVQDSLASHLFSKQRNYWQQPSLLDIGLSQSEPHRTYMEMNALIQNDVIARDSM